MDTPSIDMMLGRPAGVPPPLQARHPQPPTTAPQDVVQSNEYEDCM